MYMKLLLFDVDGTLTPPRNKIENEMLECLKKLKENPNFELGFVGGSDLNKQIEQLGQENFYLFNWRFSENGLLGYHNEDLIHQRSFVEELGEDVFKKFINNCLMILATVDCPVKRGTFIEYRNGMLNISPVGRACSQAEREEFNIYDQENNLRDNIIQQLKKFWDNECKCEKLTAPELQYSIGGQISIDIFPKGWDKTYCLQFLEGKYEENHFFGDKTDAGGNDHEIYNDSRVIGHKVEKYEDTITILDSL
jgi:phosphomannomutase